MRFGDDIRFGDDKDKFWTLNFSNRRHGFSLKDTWVFNLDTSIIHIICKSERTELAKKN